MTKRNFFYYIVIVMLTILLITGYLINKKNSSSKKNEIKNLNQQILTKNQQLFNIQKHFLKNKENINDLINPNTINFKKIISNKEIENFEDFKISKYKTNEILSSGNYRALASAYIDFYNDDKELILATVDGIFAISDLDNIQNFKKIKSNIFDLITYEDFYVNTQYGIKDILVNEEKLYVSYINEKRKDCYNLKILVSKINKEKLNFKEFFETSECVDKKNKHGYLAHQGGGGRMFVGDDSIYFTTGEFRNRPLAQKKDNDYGKILNINLKSKESKIISIGHRNPQGLYYSKKNNFIISTEHGPKGGDEVNINHEPSVKVKNFGWPISSYGEHYYKNYSTEILNKAPLNKSHKKYKFEEPLKYFVPSIGISEIIALNNDDNEFLFGAMGNEIVEQDLGLHFIKLDDQRKKVIKHKYIPLNERVRDIVISKNKDVIILFLETTSSIAIINKIKF
ncbi:PQQ-dependent sugar dehydrogenase [Candidatus Pelagibacter sp. HIMB1483]|uniref:PQQ-dependent sugar dehydrogenase n=1 Tax=Candidatus Pelagibacter sp. HIMB1483 TaxID=3415414 RepID=UPI003F8388D0